MDIIVSCGAKTSRRPFFTPVQGLAQTTPAYPSQRFDFQVFPMVGSGKRSIGRIAQW